VAVTYCVYAVEPAAAAAAAAAATAVGEVRPGDARADVG